MVRTLRFITTKPAATLGFSALLLFAPVSRGDAKGFTVLHVFNGDDGANSYSSLLSDAEGNFYGTTDGGGANHLGTVFKLAPDGTLSTIHSFGGSGDGDLPLSGLIADKSGNFYGTTQDANPGLGAVFKLAPDGTESVLHTFNGGADGATPVAPLVDDKAGNLYGTTESGGGDGCRHTGCGTVFKIATDGTETVLHSFSGRKGDGAAPVAGLLRIGNTLYGTTFYGGTDLFGIVFKLSLGGHEGVIHTFAGWPGDGANPEAGLIADAAGDLYGTTFDGGANQQGTVFRLAPDGTMTILHSFAGGSDGEGPEAGLLLDAGGNLYGTTYQGGSTACDGAGCGTIFKIAADGTETVLHAFKKKSQGINPEAPLAADRKGNLYSTASYGGTEDFGTIFELKR